MKQEEIKLNVSEQVDKWVYMMRGSGSEVILSPRAIEFLCLMIANIESDRSKYWSNESSISDQQERAISLIPNALNEVIYYRYRRPRRRMDETYYVSTWEIWHSLSRIVNRFCFVPKSI